MAEIGKITSEDLLQSNVDNAFIKLDKTVEKNIETIERLKRATIQLNNLRIKGVKDTERAERKVNRLRQESIAESKRIINLEKQLALAKQKLTAEINRNTVALNSNQKSVVRSTKSYTGLRSVLSTIITPITLVYAAFRGISKLKEQVITLDSFRFALDKITDSSSRTTETMRFLIDISDKFGVNLDVAADRYVKFYTAAKQAGINLEDTRSIYSNISKASGVLGLKTDELRGVFLALEQMLSKGKVTTEELRRQLGERLPGAFGVMAQTVDKLNPDLDVTVQTLDDMLKKGQVLSAEVLPEFAKQYNISFGIDQVDKVQTLAAAQERFRNSWTKLVFEVEEGGNIISNTFRTAFDLGSEYIDDLSDKLIILGDESTSTFKKLKLALTFFGGADIVTSGNAELAQAIIERREFNQAYLEASLVLKGFAVDLGNTLEAETEYFNNIDKLNSLKTTEEILNYIESLKKEKEAEESINFIGIQSLANLEKRRKALEEYLETKASLENINDAEIQKNKKLLEQTKEQIKQLKIALGFTEEQIRREKAKVLFDEALAAETASEAYKKLIKNLEIVSEKGDLNFDTNLNIQKLIKGLKDSLKNFEKGVDPLEIEVELKLLKNFSKSDFNDQLDKLISGGKDDSPIFNLLGSDADTIIKDYENALSQLNEGETLKFSDFLDQRIEDLEAYFELSHELTNSLFELGLTIYDNELQQIQDRRDAQESYYSDLHDLAQGDADHKRDITNKEIADKKRLDKEERKIKRKQAVLQKAQNVANVIAQTAISISEASPNPVLIALAAAIGAAQIAIVLSQPIPKYKDGRIGGPAELAYVGDGGVREVIQKKSGEAYITPNKPTLVYLDKDDTVFKNEDLYYNKLLGPKQSNTSTIIKNNNNVNKINNTFKPTINLSLNEEFWEYKQTQF